MKKIFVPLTVFAMMQVFATPVALGSGQPANAPAVQAQKTITGVVTDKNGDPLPGVVVMEKGNQNNGTITDIDGNYSLKVSDGATVVVSYVGYNSTELAVAGKTSINVTLIESSQVLDEVVAVGYATQKKVNLTGSVATVNFDQVKSRPVVNASQILSGATPGLQIMQGSGQPGSESFGFLVRGQGTLNSSGPLVLVDGMEQSISMVNPSDIESVSILKDAASCAIYGNRGANGVILITTKNGTSDRISVTYDGNFSYNTPFKVIHTVSDYARYMKLMNESATNLGNSTMFSQSSIDTWEEAKKNPNGIAASGYPNYVAYPNTDWWDEIYSKEWMQKHTVSIDGKEKRTGFSLSFSYIDNPGLMKISGTKTYMGRINLYTDVTDWLRVGTRTSANFSNRRAAGGNHSDIGGGLSTVKMIPCTYPYYDGMFGAPEGPEDDPQSHNPLWNWNTADGYNQNKRFYTDWYAQVKFLKHFTYKFDFYWYDLRREQKQSDMSIGKFSFSKGAYSTGASSPAELYTNMFYSRENLTKLSHVLSYNQSFGQHDVSAMVGYEQEAFDYRQSSASKLGLTDASINDFDAATTPYSTSGYGTQYSSRSWFGRLNYAFDNRYLFEFDMRYDGSSRFAPENRWGAFPSLSAGWRVTEEPWFNVPRWLNNLKVRASWGKLGNNSIGNYDWQSFYAATNYSFGQALASGISITAIANRDLTWEETAVTNVGVDFGLLNNRLTGNIDFYNKLTTGILYTPDMFMIMGNASGPKANIAEVTNRGVEVEIGWRDRIGSDFTYEVKGQFSYNHNNVSKYKGELKRGWNADHTEYTSNLGEVSTGSTTRVLEGHQIGEWYLPNVYKGTGTYYNGDGSVNPNGGPKDGMIRTDKDLEWAKAMQAAGYSFQPHNNIAQNGLWYGEYIYADANGDGIYGSSYDYEFQGKSYNPKYNFGLFASASYKGFDMSMQWGGAAGFGIYYCSQGRNSSETIYGYAIPDAVADDHYFYDPSNPSDPRTNIDSKNPRLVNVSGSQSAATSSLHLENGSYLKLRNLTIGYTLPKAITRKFFVENLRVYASGENLFAITNFSGLDPEMNTAAGYTTMRQYALGVNITF